MFSKRARACCLEGMKKKQNNYRRLYLLAWRVCAHVDEYKELTKNISLKNSTGLLCAFNYLYFLDFLLFFYNF